MSGGRQQRVLHLFQGQCPEHPPAPSPHCSQRPGPSASHLGCVTVLGPPPVAACVPRLCKKAQRALQNVLLSPSLSVCPQSWQSRGHHVFFSKLFPARFLTAALTGLQHPLALPTAETGAGHRRSFPILAICAVYSSPNKRVEPGSPASQADSLLSEPPGKPSKCTGALPI